MEGAFLIRSSILNALQEKEIERIGGKAPIKVDVQIIAATNRDLEKEVRNGKFRNDLFYRLNVFPIYMPALKSRKEDIPILADYFMKRFARISGRKVTKLSERAMQDLLTYHWPGNVRELEHMMEPSVLLSPGSVIEEVYLSVNFRKEEETTAKVAYDQVKTIDENERDHIITVLKKCNGKISGHKGAAEMLDIPASTLNSKISKLGIKKGHFFDDKKINENKKDN